MLEYTLSTPFQNRLVGTIIVAAAIVIFLPDVLDGKKKSHQADFEAIPKAPTFVGAIEEKNFPAQRVTLTVEALVDEQAQDELLTAEQEGKTNNTVLAADGVKVSTYPKVAGNAIENITPQNQTKLSTKKTVQTKAVLTKVLPEKAIAAQAWVIHLGSFRHKKNVSELLAKLKHSGYTTYTKPIKTKQGVLTKVFIGPELIKSSLEKKLPALKQLTKIQGKIARFKPTK